MSTVKIPEDILRDLEKEHGDIVEIGILREEKLDDQIKLMIEVKTTTMYIVYEYILDSSTQRVISRDLLYALPLT
ncbi:MAG: hypothetical protein GXO10_05620 [Crenarchaeota archaeon]|nr:hypothetical protein [Thermoproteota archaeon]